METQTTCHVVHVMYTHMTCDMYHVYNSKCLTLQSLPSVHLRPRRPLRHPRPRHCYC